MCSKLSPPGIYLLRWDGLGGRGWRNGVCSQAMSWQVGKRQTWTCLRAQPCPPDTSVAGRHWVGWSNEPSPAGKSSRCHFSVERWLFQSAQQQQQQQPNDKLGVTISHYWNKEIRNHFLFDDVLMGYAAERGFVVFMCYTFISFQSKTWLTCGAAWNFLFYFIFLYHGRMENCRLLCHLFVGKIKSSGQITIWGLSLAACTTLSISSPAHAGILQKCPNMFTSDHQNSCYQ